MSKLEELVKTDSVEKEDELYAQAMFMYRTVSHEKMNVIRPMSNEQFELIPKYGVISDINALVMQHHQERKDFTDIAGFKLFYTTALDGKNVIVSQDAMNELIKVLTENTILRAENQKLKTLQQVAKKG